MTREASALLRFATRSAPSSDRALVMAIVNRTPAPFYDRGATCSGAAAVASVDAAVADGADVIDIGGVKAGPSAAVDTTEKTRRVVPLVAATQDRHPDIVISVDTWRAGVGRLAYAGGAELLDDTWAGTDPALAEVAAEYGIGIVCSHTGDALPRTRPHRIRYTDIVDDVILELTDQAERLVDIGVRRSGILVDPTHDLGKNTWHGLELLRRCDRLVASGWPALMALSHKDVVGETLGVDLEGRFEGTLAATAIAAWSGARVFRAHDVRATLRTLEMVAAVAGARTPARTVRGLV